MSQHSLDMEYCIPSTSTTIVYHSVCWHVGIWTKKDLKIKKDNICALHFVEKKLYKNKCRQHILVWINLVLTVGHVWHCTESHVYSAWWTFVKPNICLLFRVLCWEVRPELHRVWPAGEPGQYLRALQTGTPSLRIPVLSWNDVRPQMNFTKEGCLITLPNQNNPQAHGTEKTKNTNVVDGRPPGMGYGCTLSVSFTIIVAPVWRV